MGACSCSHNEEKQEAATGDAEITAMAEEAAERIAHSDHSDTLAMQEAIMDARAKRSTLIIEGNKEGAEIFDNALHDRLKKLDTQLCDSIFGTQQ